MAGSDQNKQKHTIALAAQDALQVVANAAAEAMKITNVTTTGDHDLIVELKIRLEDCLKAIWVLSDGVSKRIENHETRIGDVEKIMNTLKEQFSTVKNIVYGMVSVILLAFVGALVALVFTK